MATKCASNINEQEGQGQGGCDRFTAIYSIQLLDIVSIKFYSALLLDIVGFSIKLVQLQWAVE